MNLAHPGFRPSRIRRRAGAIVWISSIQFFIAQVVVQSAWTTPFSLRANYISDLGNTACGPFPLGTAKIVCSPWHTVMNASFVLIGLTTVLGALLVRDAIQRTRSRSLGLALIVLAGLGFVLVGLFPENVNFPPHRLGAGLQFVCGNLGQVVLGGAMLRTRSNRGFAAYSIASGIVGLLATVLFVSAQYLNMGIGGMERLAAYPMPLWMIVAGIIWWRAPSVGSVTHQLEVL